MANIEKMSYAYWLIFMGDEVLCVLPEEKNNYKSGYKVLQSLMVISMQDLLLQQ